MPIPLLVALPAAAAVAGGGAGFVLARKTDNLILLGALGFAGWLVVTGKVKI